jgi:iron complex outermembrane receptor protein
MVYVTHRQGYRAGGTNPLVAPALQATPAIPNAQGLFTYAPETLRDVEIGLKSEFNVSDWKIRANIALYKDWLDNAQINQTFTVGTQTVSALTNAASANIKGVEAEITVAPSRHFNVLFAYAYTNAKYGSFVDYTHRDPVTGAPGLSTGRIFPFTPHHKLNIAPTLTLPTPSDWGELTLNANYAFKSSIILGLVPFITLPSGANMFDGESRQKATNTVDLNVQWAHIFGSRFDASFFITNVTNTVYKIGGASLINSGLGINQRIYNEPRMFGGTIRVHFGGHS